MTASRLNPNIYKGEERDGGIISRNRKPTSASSPHWRGKIYLKGVGWYWISGWMQGPDDNPYIALRAQEMTDEQAQQFCKPKPSGGGKLTSQSRPNYPPASQNGANSDSDIPF